MKQTFKISSSSYFDRNNVLLKSPRDLDLLDVQIIQKTLRLDLSH